MDDTWDLLIATGSSDVEESRLTNALASLEETLSEDSAAEETISGILSRTLEGDTDERTWDTMTDALASYVGLDAAYLCFWIAHRDSLERLDRVAEFASPSGIRLLRKISGLFGHGIRAAILRRNEFENDWQHVVIRVFQDPSPTGSYVQLDLLKVSGDRVRLEGGVDSFVALTSHCLRALAKIGNSEAFSPDVIATFKEDLEEFTALVDSSEGAKGVAYVSR